MNVVTEVAENILLQQTCSNKRECFDDECNKAVYGRNRAHKSYLCRPTGCTLLEYGQLRRKTDKICRKKKRVKTTGV
jgi:hypothetical protein